MKKQYSYSIYRPGGNDTALVETKVDDLAMRRKINQVIINQNPNVEQVAFVYWQKNPMLKQKQANFSMAGYEFSGNGLRAACTYFLKNKPGKIDINIEKIKAASCSINQKKDVKAEIPIYKNFNSIKKIKNYYLVNMPGTKNIVIQTKCSLGKKIAIKKAKQIINQLNFWDEPGLAILFINKKQDAYLLEPVYWIKEMNTLTYETACGSGSTAVVLLDAYLKNSSISKQIIQPSQQSISVDIKIQANQFQKAFISGPVQKLKQGIIKI